MAKKFKLKASLLNDLVNAITVSPKAYLDMFSDTDLAGLHRYDKLKDELMEANVAYTDAISDVVKISKPISERVDAVAKEFETGSKEHREAIDAANEEINATPEKAKMREEGEREIEVEVGSNERFDILVATFNHKTTIAKWNDTKALLTIDDALLAAVEA
ncbi:MAG: hypothetical protein M0R06_01965 [Sphaerochaeta sp.]|jgi:hypothetical protein|nr:hypothetical protein [Sphaerochaeta sp.]